MSTKTATAPSRSARRSTRHTRVRSTRREPAHREPYVRLRNAQVEHPQILSAYDAVEQWISSQGLTDAGSPREVYFTEFDLAGPADEVCDVAYPIRSANR